MRPSWSRARRKAKELGELAAFGSRGMIVLFLLQVHLQKTGAAVEMLSVIVLTKTVDPS